MNPLAKLTGYLKKIQQQPYRTRVRILWGTTMTVGLVLVIIWFFSVKQEVSRIDNTDLLGIQENEPPAQEAKYVKAERIEQTSTSLKILFSVNNSSNDILNFSSDSEVSLVVNGSSTNPVRILDRQNKGFVQKVLSKTENFGTLIFPKIDFSQAELIFEDLHFENEPDKIFKESLPLNFTELNKEQELRK